MPEQAPAIHLRDEYEVAGLGAAEIGDIERRLSLYERISNVDAVRKLTILVSLVVVCHDLSDALRQAERVIEQKAHRVLNHTAKRVMANTVQSCRMAMEQLRPLPLPEPPPDYPDMGMPDMGGMDMGGMDMGGFDF